MYRFFDFCIDSALPLTGLPACAGEAPAWSIAVDDGADAAPAGEPFHRWTAPNGQELMSAARLGEAYLLQFPGLARFRVDFAARRIEARPLADCPAHTLAHLLLDQVLPRAVCHEGRVVLHASAVLLAPGQAIAFSGPSGRGKSTLAAAFHRAGCGLLSDDCLLLQPRAGGMLAIPAYGSLRLWQDSLTAMYGDRAAAASQVAHYMDKRQLLPVREARPDGPAAAAASAGEWPRLAALFLLDEPAPTEAAGAVRIERSGGSAALAALIGALFALDVVDRAALQRAFSSVGRAAGSVATFRLAYARDYGMLPAVVDKVRNSFQFGAR
ncbi:MAG: hypothetical protein EHM68_16555 [Lysobacterales bacterium]|nr:MAG: hypothetical protein EHM68_16555 [Xanthomonadales bacterium]